MTKEMAERVCDLTYRFCLGDEVVFLNPDPKFVGIPFYVYR